MPQRTIEKRLEDIQRRMGVRPDGLLGPITLSAIERLLDQALGRLPTPVNLVVSDASLDLIVRFEITSFARYERALSHPIWPGAASGVTIGIGYDLGHNSGSQIERDWRGRLADATVDEMLTAAGVKGTEARDLVPGLQHLTIPLDAAREVFYVATLPRYADKTRRAYAGIEDLPADAQGAMLSLIFNRGASMRATDRRREMRAIRPLVTSGDLAGIAEQIRSMKRLWDPAVLPGLHTRRDKEADLVAGADRHYDPAELVNL